jgi:hypothetical protein
MPIIEQLLYGYSCVSHSHSEAAENGFYRPTNSIEVLGGIRQVDQRPRCCCGTP